MKLASFLNIFIVTLLFSLSAEAQKLRKFSEEPGPYLEEISKLLREISDKETTERLSAHYLTIWSEGILSGAEQKLIFEISNQMLRRRLVDISQWSDLINVLVHLKLQEDEKFHKPMLDDIEDYLKKNPTRSSADYLRTLRQCFTEGVFYDDDRLRWMRPDDRLEFDFKDGPRFSVRDGDLWAFHKDDSTHVELTSGYYDPKTYLFTGQGGRIFFIRAGKTTDTAYVELNRYRINMSKTGFEIDSVVLHTKLYITEPIMGKFTERVSSRSDVERATFPRFVSYRKDLMVADLFKNVDYKGGYSVIGRKIYASGTADNPATFWFKYNDKPLIKVTSTRVLLKPKIINAEEVKVALFMDGDSMYHPQSAMRFIPEQNVLVLNREDRGLSKTPYTNTYHNLDMFFENLTWQMDQPQLMLGNVNMGSVTPVIFESNNYYRGERFQALMGLANVNPLYYIRDASLTYDSREIHVEDMARALGMTAQETHRYMLDLSIAGFVNYDLNTNIITVNDKVFDYINNFEETRDFDVIRFISALERGSNASLSLETFNMEIRGIKGIALSDSQKVAMYPYGQKITVQRGLNFAFDGRINAGRFNFWGQQFYFDYDKFQVNMNQIDSMRFKVESFQPDAAGNRPLVDVKNVLQDINGELLIDKPNNKSGKESHHEYPIFRSGKESYVYYDRPNIFNSVYKRDNFFVELEPFEIDSLDNTTTEGLKFRGVFTSAGIFPNMEEEIQVQEDYSLGFKTNTPPGGFAAYGGKGRVEAALQLSNRGLRGNGQIDYLTSTANGDDFIFFPDSTNGIASKYEIRAQLAAVEYPHVTAKGVKLHWEPKNDVMYTTSTSTPFNMYDDIGMKANGTLAQSPQKLAGRGRLDFLNAQTDSEDYLFKNMAFHSDKLDFRVKANPEAEWGFEMPNARGDVDFKMEKGEFRSNDPAQFIYFPINQYACLMDFAEWKIPEKAVEVKKLAKGASSLMVSTHPKQDSLQFNAGHAKFYLEPSLLEGFDIPHIDVADARVFPDSGYVAIDPGADMRELTQSTLMADRITKHHNFQNATLKITSRKNYFGKADYDYEDEDQVIWPLHFEEIKVDREGRTVGYAKVEEEDAFYLSPFFAYYGKVHLEAPEKHLVFDGYTLIQETCENIVSNWFKFKSRIDPNRIIIDLPEDNPRTRADNIYNGIYIAPDSTSGYSAFLSKENSRADQELFSATGVLYYDKDIYSYIITTREKALDHNARGNYLELNNRDCITTGKGELTFGDDLGRVNIRSFGIITHNLNNDVIETDQAMIMNFHFSDAMLKAMAEAMQAKTSLAGADLTEEPFRIYTNEIFDTKAFNKFWDEVTTTGAPDKLPRDLESTITFSKLKFVWNPETNSLVSEGPIGIASILRLPINKEVEGIIEIQRKRRGDEITIYLKVPGGDYYFFNYRRNLMQFFTTDNAIMETMRELKTKDRSLDKKGNLPPYTFNQTTKGRVSRFLNQFE